MKSIIANNTDAAGFADGSKTGFIVPIKVQPYLDKMGNFCQGKINYGQNLDGTPQLENFAKCTAPYSIGQEVSVREAWCDGFDISGFDGHEYCVKSDIDPIFRTRDNWVEPKWNSPATMPISAARTIIIPTSVKCVRVQDVCALKMGFRGTAIECVQQFYKYLVAKYGQAAWDNNIYVFFYECKRK